MIDEAVLVLVITDTTMRVCRIEPDESEDMMKPKKETKEKK